MSERLGDAVLALRTDDTAFTRGIKKAEAQTKRLGRIFDDVGRKAQRIGRQLATFVTLPILAIGAASVKTASEIQEMQNLFDVTFESAADDVEEWAARMATAMQRSRFDLMKTASEFAAFLKPLGVAPDQIVPMSKALTALTTDIASFRNQADKEVFIRLFSGLAGETEAVRRLGIDIGVASVKQELLNLGFKGGIVEATQGQKVLARFSLIMRQTSDAQGDAARTAFTFENQVKGLGATITDVRVDIGQRLLPVATRLVMKLRELGKDFLALSEETKSGVVAVAGFVSVIGPAIFALGLLSRAIGFAISGFAFLSPVGKLIKKAFGLMFKGIRLAAIRFVTFFGGVPLAIIASLAALVGVFFIFKDTIVGFFKGLVLAIADEFVVGFHNLVVIPFQEQMNALLKWISKPIPKFLRRAPLFEVAEPMLSTLGDDMKKVMAEAAENGKRELEDFKNTAIKVVDIVKTKFGELGGAIADFLPDLELADFSLENIGAQFDALMAKFGALNTAQGGVADAAAKAAKDAADAWEDFGKTIRDSMEDNLTRALTKFNEFGNAARAILNEIFTGLVRLAIVKPFLAAFGLPGFAQGGRHPNAPFIAGERGMEVVFPDRAGTVIPNNELGAMGGISQEFNFPLAFPTQLEAFIRNVAGPAGREEAIGVLRAMRGRF